jgi:DNA-directed RNA polymerase subunit D
MITILELTDTHCKCKITTKDRTVVHLLRRAIVSRIPVMAIDYVSISKNSSVINDELLSHRIGMIPLISDEMGDTNETYYTLNVKGPTYVTSNNLIFNTGNEKIKPIADIPIIRLKDGETIELTAMAKRGIASEHAKWSITSVVYYYNIPQVKIMGYDNEEIDSTAPSGRVRSKVEVDDNIRQWLNECSVSQMFKLSDNSIIINRDKYEYFDECVAIASKYGITVTINENTDEYIFGLDTVGSLKPENVISSAMDVVIQNTKQAKNSV